MSDAQMMQKKYSELASQLDLVKSQILGLERSIRYAEVTKSQVESDTTKSARVWQGVGKMFMATSVQEFEESIKKRSQDAEEQASALKKKKVYLELTIKNLAKALEDSDIALPQ